MNRHSSCGRGGRPFARFEHYECVDRLAMRLIIHLALLDARRLCGLRPRRVSVRETSSFEWLMLHPTLRCPQCEQCAFIVPNDPAELDNVHGAICHCCGHYLDTPAIRRRLEAMATEEARKIRPR